MSTALHESECTPLSVLKAFMELDLPDGNDFDVSTSAGSQSYINAWRLFAQKSGVLGHKLAVCSALTKRDRLTTIISKVSRFVERSREHALRSVDACTMFEAARDAQAEESDWLRFLSIFGKPKELERRKMARNKSMMKVSDKMTKEYDRLWRERELLRSQIQALVPELQP